MKNILAILTLATLTATAADVVVVSANSLTVDGVQSGAVADTIRNRPELASAIQLALVKWEAAKTVELKAAQDALAAALATRTALIAKANEVIAKLTPADQIIMRDLLTEASLPEVERKRAALIAELAAQQAALAAKQAEITALK